MPVCELSQLPSIWPRNGLVARNLGAIQNDLRSGGEILLPVVVRCEPGPEGVVVDLVAGEHRIEAALREGCPELSVQVLIASQSEALLWLLRESAAPGTPRTILEQAWAIERWIRGSGFQGTQRELSVTLGISDSKASELRKFARALPENEVMERSERTGVAPVEISAIPRAALREVARHSQEEVLPILDFALKNLQTGMTANAAWGLALKSSPSAGEVRPSSATMAFRAIARCYRTSLTVFSTIATASVRSTRAVAGFLLRTLRALKRTFLAAKRRRGQRDSPDVATSA